VAATPDQDGYVTLQRTWQAGDTVQLELDMTPRLVFPHHRIDAVRGTVAVERGPLVYCFEQADQPDGIDVEDLALRPGDELRATDVPDLAGVGRTVLVEADAYAVSQPREGLPYSTTPPEEQVNTQATRATAIPYYQWDNRDGRAMRVWLPVTAGSS
jgi:uncharacterized protein